MEKEKEQLILQNPNTKIYCGIKLMGEEYIKYDLTNEKDSFGIFVEKTDRIGIIISIFKKWGIYQSFTDSDLKEIAEEILKKLDESNS